MRVKLLIREKKRVEEWEWIFGFDGLFLVKERSPFEFVCSKGKNHGLRSE